MSPIIIPSGSKGGRAAASFAQGFAHALPGAMALDLRRDENASEDERYRASLALALERDAALGLDRIEDNERADAAQRSLDEHRKTMERFRGLEIGEKQAGRLQQEGYAKAAAEGFGLLQNPPEPAMGPHEAGFDPDSDLRKRAHSIAAQMDPKFQARYLAEVDRELTTRAKGREFGYEVERAATNPYIAQNPALAQRFEMLRNGLSQPGLTAAQIEKMQGALSGLYKEAGSVQAATANAGEYRSRLDAAIQRQSSIADALDAEGDYERADEMYDRIEQARAQAAAIDIDPMKAREAFNSALSVLRPGRARAGSKKGEDDGFARRDKIIMRAQADPRWKMVAESRLPEAEKLEALRGITRQYEEYFGGGGAQAPQQGQQVSTPGAQAPADERAPRGAATNAYKPTPDENTLIDRLILEGKTDEEIRAALGGAGG